jgi:class 3 adenylate cyclase
LAAFSTAFSGSKILSPPLVSRVIAALRPCGPAAQGPEFSVGTFGDGRLSKIDLVKLRYRADHLGRNDGSSTRGAPSITTNHAINSEIQDATPLDNIGQNTGMNATELRSRLMAILAADAAGYSRLMSLDDRATVAALDAARLVFREHIAMHGGRVIDTAGDSVLAVFDTAAGAVRAALAIQQQLTVSATDPYEDRHLQFRIGLHLGDVIEKADGTVYGDGVNIAARLQGLAEPGGVTLSDSIRHAVKGSVAASFEDQGEQAVKNIAEAVRAYRIVLRPPCQHNNGGRPHSALGPGIPGPPAALAARPKA